MSPDEPIILPFPSELRFDAGNPFRCDIPIVPVEAEYRIPCDMAFMYDPGPHTPTGDYASFIPVPTQSTSLGSFSFADPYEYQPHFFPPPVSHDTRQRLTLTEEQRQAIRSQAGQPIEVEDPVTHQRYVLLPADVYEQLQQARNEKA